MGIFKPLDTDLTKRKSSFQLGTPTKIETTLNVYTRCSTGAAREAADRVGLELARIGQTARDDANPLKRLAPQLDSNQQPSVNSNRGAPGASLDTETLWRGST